MSTVTATTETSTESTILILSTVKATTTPTSISTTTTPTASSTTSSITPPSIKAITPSTTTTPIRNVIQEKRVIYLK